jgi:hypothetical protein
MLNQGKECPPTLGAERTKNKLADTWKTDKSRPYAQQVISAESLEWPVARCGSSRSPSAGSEAEAQSKYGVVTEQFIYK